MKTLSEKKKGDREKNTRKAYEENGVAVEIGKEQFDKKAEYIAVLTIVLMILVGIFIAYDNRDILERLVTVFRDFLIK